MKISLCQSAFCALLLCLIASVVSAQRQKPPDPFVFGNPEAAGVTNTVFGDFRIEDRTASSDQKPQSFNVVLYNNQGRQIMRQNVSSNGRYYFSNVPNGEYFIAVELQGNEVTRISVRLASMARSEVRRDIELEWRDNSFKSAKPEVISAKDSYSRSENNQKLFDKAQEAISKKDHKQAVSLLNQVVSADNKDFQAWVSMGTVYFIDGKHSESEKSFRNALSAKTDSMIAMIGLGKAQMAQKNYDAAIETLTKAVEADPKSAEANFLLGESYLQIKKGSKAVGYLYEAIRLDPTGMADAHLRLGTLYRAAGLKDKAVVEFEAFLAKKPDYPDRGKLQQYISENKSK